MGMIKLGRLVVIEGIDGSGKRTQWRLLMGWLKQMGKRVVGVDFPRYKTSVWGKLLKELLAGKHGDFQKLTPYLSTLPYILDQAEWMNRVGKKALGEGKWVVANRYVTSNVHQIYKLQATSNKRQEFSRWFWKLVYGELGLPQPDLVLWLDVPPEVSYKLQVTSNKRQDKADLDLKYQLAAYRGYKDMCKLHKNWVEVHCVEGGELLTKQEVSGRIRKILHEKFKAI